MRIELALASSEHAEVVEGLVRVLAALDADERYTDVALTEEDGEYILVATTTVMMRNDDAEHQQQ
jgi:hypothetical protein